MKNWTLSTILLFVSLAWSQDFDKAKLDQYFDLLEENDKYMGSVAVSRGGEMLYTRSLGYCDLSAEAMASSDSRYRIGSISKTFTAVLVFKAIEAKKLALEQTLDEFFPEIVNAEAITIKQLLGNRSGIHNITDDELYLTYMTQPKSKEEMVEIIVEAGSDFEPDSQFKYSNSNFILLTYILEQSMGMPYAELLRKHITTPLKLSDTYVGAKIGAKDNECKSYLFNESWQENPETDMSIPVGAGAIVSNPTDIVKFSNALFGGELIKMEYVEMMKNIQEGYGLGLFSFPFQERRSYGHTGGIDGFTSIFGHFEDGDVSFAMTSNGANMNTNDIAIAVLSTVYDQPFEMPEFKSYDVSHEQLEEYVGTYTAADFPLDIEITAENGLLKAQATGQQPFALEAVDEHQFKFAGAGISMAFDPGENTMLFEQGTIKVNFTRQ